MAAAAEILTNKPARRQLYLQRVDDFFAQVETWLPEDLVLVACSRRIQDETGEYDAPSYSVIKKCVPEPDDFVAELFPQGCSVLLAEGMIELDGPYGTERIVYLEQKNILRLPRNGQTRPIFKGVDHDGWYWLEDPRRSRMLPITPELLFELLEMVSGYEPD